MGEAPGAVETRTGEVFTGPSGQLLERVLSHHGIDRNTVRLTNVAACHPPYKPGQGSVVPPKGVIAACQPRLESELEGRDQFLLLGNTAKEAVLRTSEGITRVRVGPPKQSDRYPDVAIVPTIHPAACLRNPDSFHDLVKDVGKLVDTRVWTDFEPPTFVDTEDSQVAIQYLKQLLERPQQIITLDIETGVEKDDDFTHPSSLLCVGLGYEPNKAVVIGEQPCQNKEVLKWLRLVCEKHQIVCHNGKYDIQVLMRLGILRDPYCLYGDTMLASYVLDERPGHHSLGALGSEVLGAPDWKGEISKYVGKGDSYAVVPRNVLYKYNAWDAALDYNLWFVLEPLMDAQDVRRVHDRLIRYSHEFIYVELEGVKFDLEYNQHLWDHYHELLVPMVEELREIVEEPLYNPNSWQQTGRILQEMGFKVPNTQADTLQRLLETKGSSDGRLAGYLSTLLAYKKENKSYGTYVKGLRKRQLGGRIYSTFLLHGSVTGRTASRNPNVQNITRGATLRKQFVPEEGFVFVQCDYGQIEGRIEAIEAACEYLLGIFNDPSRDLFDEMGAKLYGPTAVGDKVKRIRTKAYFYGTNYGREAFSIAQEFRISEREAQRDMNAWFEMIPEIVDYQNAIKQEVRTGVLQTHFGRKRRFGLLTRDTIRDIEKEALAFPPQSTANDINLSALCEIRKSGLHVRIPVHDSIMVECPEEDKHDVAKYMTETMERVAAEEYSDRLPFPADAEFGYNWGELSEA